MHRRPSRRRSQEGLGLSIPIVAVKQTQKSTRFLAFLNAGKPSVSDAKQRFVPETYERPSGISEKQLSPSGEAPAKQRLDPGVLPGQARGLDSSPEVLRH